MSTAAIAQFRERGDIIHRLTRGLTDADLVAFPVAGTWSLKQLCVHLLDSDIAATHRMKRIIAEETPLLIAYDETAFARSLFYHEMDMGIVAELFRHNRLHMSEVLERLPSEAFARCGVHNQRGKVTLLQMVEMYVQHVDHHLVFARAKLAALGKQITV
jgi:uncharacterized damage-inducible protein DinB